MTSHVRVTAVLVALPGKSDAVQAAIETVATHTRKEEGCIQYDPHRCTTDSNKFLFLEEWVSQDHLDAHMHQPHLLAFREKVSGLLAHAPEVLVWKPL